MILNGIKISWTYSDEYVEIDFTEMDYLPIITSTIEFWREDKIWIRYYTTSKVKQIADGIYEITITYDKGCNTHIDPVESLWGNSVITIDTKSITGTAKWQDESNPKNDGTCRWIKIDHPLVCNKKREVISRIQREQEQFRAALLALDERCVLTGETTKEALEAAHIIPAKNGGREIVQNGIILRADIHRLYDANIFSIDQFGKVKFNEVTNEHYINLLKDAQLRAETLNRVKRALTYLGAG